MDRYIIDRKINAYMHAQIYYDTPPLYQDEIISLLGKLRTLFGLKHHFVLALLSYHGPIHQKRGIC